MCVVLSCAPKQTENTDSVQEKEKSSQKKSSKKNKVPVSGEYEPYPVFKASEILDPEILKGESSSG